MITQDVLIEIQGETVALLPERAVFWPQRSMLLVADAHWGKAAAFRAASIAVPGEMTDDDLNRLSRAIDRTNPERIVFLGDLLHARKGRAPRTLEIVQAWRERYADIDMLLVRGNHDRGAGDPPDNWHIRCADGPVIEPPFAFQHDPAPHEAFYTVAGHIHPGVRLSGPARESFTLPCFWFGEHVGVLPAFGSFTGLGMVSPTRTDHVFVIADEDVIEVR